MHDHRRPFPPAHLGAFALLVFLCAHALGAAAVADPPSLEQVQFFEKNIRPVLMDRCYQCHSSRSEKIRGGLVLETRAAVLKGGESGAVIVPGDPEASLLIKAIRHTDEKLKMPPKGQPLTAAEVADFEKWVAMGAPDPRVAAAGAPGGHPAGPVFTAAERGYWALQPVKPVAPPSVSNPQQAANPIDAFILSELQSKGLQPSPPADKI